jgi:hypothetical protein
MNIRLLPSLLLSVLTIGCASKYIDISNSVVRQEVAVPPYYFYYDTAWISDHLIALAYEPEYAITENSKISIYHSDSEKLAEVPMPEPGAGCQSKWGAGNIAVSPNGNLAFNTVCFSDRLAGPQLLMQYDVQNDQLAQLFEYYHASATHFSFIDANELLQEDAVGYPMSDELYRISLTDRSKTRLVPNFVRASRPSWSSANKLIAFWGTDRDSGTTPGAPVTFEDIARLVTSPWDLYVMDKNGNNSRKILTLIDHARGLSWSSVDGIIAFGGTIQGTEGIWLFDFHGGKPIRIFDHNEVFGWSPDGKKLIVVEAKEYNEKNNLMPVAAYILEMPPCVSSRTCQ